MTAVNKNGVYFICIANMTRFFIDWGHPSRTNGNLPGSWKGAFWTHHLRSVNTVREFGKWGTSLDMRWLRW